MNWRKYICKYIRGHKYSEWISLFANKKVVHVCPTNPKKYVRYWQCECSKCGMELDFAEQLNTKQDPIPVDFMRNIQKQWRYKV